MRNYGVFPHPDALEAEAARWSVRLAAPDLSPGERADFQVWLAADDTHRQAFEASQRVWWALDLAGGAAEGGRLSLPADLELEIADAGARLAARLPARRRALRRRLLWGVAAGLAAGLLLPVALARLGLPRPGPRVPEAGLHETAVGERREVGLGDGSAITLNADSRIETRLTPRLREVTMRHGEAFFKVAKDPSRPFVVQVAGGSVTAVGTAFNVFLRHGVARVTVIEGEVEVERLPPSATVREGDATPLSGRQPVRLAERQTVALDAPVLEPRTLEPARIAAATSWRRGLLEFDAAPLSDVIEAIDPYVSGRIEIADPRIAGLLGGGIVRVDSAESILKAIEIAWQVRVTRESPDRIVLSAGEPAAPLAVPHSVPDGGTGAAARPLK